MFGQHLRVGISRLHFEQDLLDRLANKADLNRVIEYEGKEVVLDDRENEGVVETEEGMAETE